MTKKKQRDWKIVVTALLCITVLELYALNQGVNGVLLSVVLVVLAGAAGYNIPKLLATK